MTARALRSGAPWQFLAQGLLADAGALAARSSTPLATYAAVPGTASTVDAVSLSAHFDPESEISIGRANSDFEVAIAEPGFDRLWERHGRYLFVNPKLVIRMRRHCRRARPAKSNLALGQERADSVRQAR